MVLMNRCFEHSTPVTCGTAWKLLSIDSGVCAGTTTLRARNIVAHVRNQPSSSKTPLLDALQAVYPDETEMLTDYNWDLLKASEVRELASRRQEDRAHALYQRLHSKIHAAKVWEEREEAWQQSTGHRPDAGDVQFRCHNAWSPLSPPVTRVMDAFLH